MSWTYDPTKFNDTTASSNYPPATLGQLMQVRLLIQDTQTTRQLLQDDEIYWLITTEANANCAAAACCESLVARAGSIKSKKASELAIAYDPNFYRMLAMQLRARGAGHQVPYAGGISIADKSILQTDPDWVAPAIPCGLDNNPAAPAPATPATPNASNPLTTI